MANIIIPYEHRADKQCEKEIVGAQHWNLKEMEVFKKMGRYHRDPLCRGTAIDDYYDSQGRRIFRAVMPIWKNDTFISVLKRYCEVFAWEFNIIKDQVAEAKKIQTSEKGFSKSKEFKWNGSIPETLYGIMKHFFPEYLTKKGLIRLKTIIPQLFT